MIAWRLFLQALQRTSRRAASCHRGDRASRFPGPVVTAELCPQNVDESAGQRHQSVGVRAVLGPLVLVEASRPSAASEAGERGM